MGDNTLQMERTLEKCRISNISCEQCSGKAQCPKHQVTERLRNDRVDLQSTIDSNNGAMQNQQIQITTLNYKNSQLNDRVLKLEEFIGSKRMKEFNKKGKKVEGEPETASTIEKEAVTTELLTTEIDGDTNPSDGGTEFSHTEEKKEPITMTSKNHLFEIKCPKCGGFWHDPENNVSREELCKECKEQTLTDNRIVDTREYDEGRPPEDK